MGHEGLVVLEGAQYWGSPGESLESAPTVCCQPVCGMPGQAALGGAPLRALWPASPAGSADPPVTRR